MRYYFGLAFESEYASQGWKEEHELSNKVATIAIKRNFMMLVFIGS